MNRRYFLQGTLASFFAHATAQGKFQTSIDLIPSAKSQAPNYWCTWAAQNYVYGQGAPSLDIRELEGEAGNKIAHNALNEDLLLGSHGWANTFFPKVRDELYLLLDDGWEAGGPASFLLDPAKFPSFQGDPAARLRALNTAIQQAGWRSLAVWCRDTPGAEADRALVLRSQQAGISYWKIDGGDPGFNIDRLRSKLQVPLMVEHVHPELPLNGDWRKDGRFPQQSWNSDRVQVLRRTDVYRTYDTNSILSLPTTLDRVSQLLHAVQGHDEVRALLNVEDEPYVAAALGCTMGILRFPEMGKRPSGDIDLFFAGPRKTKLRIDEVVRAIRWQRIAAPFAAGHGSVALGEEVLTDDWTFRRGETWYSESIGQSVKQSAPGRIARNLSVPIVRSDGPGPFVFCARFPNGSVAIAAQERTTASHGWFMPEADITLDCGDAPGPFGIFGFYRSLTLRSSRLAAGTRLLAQDLAASEATDITRFVKRSGNEVMIPGAILRRLGLQAATPGDPSDPGLVLVAAG